MTRPILYIFTISHFCEKARWALSYLDVDVEVRTLAPGSHVKVAQQLGLKRGSVPFLKTQNDVIQGSDAIITWAETQHTGDLSLGSQDPTVLEIEKRLDKNLGVHIRRWFYSEAIIECPELVKPIFLHGIPVFEKLKFTIKWPVIRKVMVKRMDLGHQQGLDSLAIVQQEIDWLDSLISLNGSYLVGDTLTRADITAASLLAPLVMPPEYSCSDLMKLPPRAKQESNQLIDRPFWNWVLKQYQANRH